MQKELSFEVLCSNSKFGQMNFLAVEKKSFYMIRTCEYMGLQTLSFYHKLEFHWLN